MKYDPRFYSQVSPRFSQESSAKNAYQDLVDRGWTVTKPYCDNGEWVVDAVRRKDAITRILKRNETLEE